jgi:hypothetical protein
MNRHKKFYRDLVFNKTELDKLSKDELSELRYYILKNSIDWKRKSEVLGLYFRY